MISPERLRPRSQPKARAAAVATHNVARDIGPIAHSVATRRRVDHRLLRLAREATLQVTRDRIGEAHERVPGPRQRVEVVPDAVVRCVPFDREALLADLAMSGERAVREADPTHT